MKQVGRGKYTLEQENEILEQGPTFNPETSPAQPNYGIFAEFFRKCLV